MPTKGTATKRIAITQSDYLPWKGWFDTINAVDEFVLYDDVQYTRRDWRNRNRIKTPEGLHWLTVPVVVKGRYEQRIEQTRISDPRWAADHWQTIRHAYARAPYFREVGAVFEKFYAASGHVMLSDLNRDLVATVCALVGIDTPLTSSADYPHAGDKTERLVEICRAAGATEYVSGPAARAYLDEAAFTAHGIGVSYLDYSGYPEYPQLWGAFEHSVSIVDLLFNVGSDAAPSYMKSFA